MDGDDCIPMRWKSEFHMMFMCSETAFFRLPIPQPFKHVKPPFAASRTTDSGQMRPAGRVVHQATSVPSPRLVSVIAAANPYVCASSLMWGNRLRPVKISLWTSSCSSAMQLPCKLNVLLRFHAMTYESTGHSHRRRANAPPHSTEGPWEPRELQADHPQRSSSESTQQCWCSLKNVWGCWQQYFEFTENWKKLLQGNECK